RERHLCDIELAITQHSKECLFDNERKVRQFDAVKGHTAFPESLCPVVVPARHGQAKLGGLRRHRSHGWSGCRACCRIEPLSPGHACFFHALHFTATTFQSRSLSEVPTAVCSRGCRRHPSSFV